MRDGDLDKYKGQIIYVDTAGMGYVGVLKDFYRETSNLYGSKAILEPAKLVPHTEGVGLIYSDLRGIKRFEEDYSGRAEISLESIIAVFSMPKDK